MSQDYDLKSLKAPILRSGRGSDGRVRAIPDLRRRVLAAISENSLTLDDAAKSLGIASSTIGKWKKKAARLVPDSDFQKIAVIAKTASKGRSSDLRLTIRDGIEIQGLTLDDVVRILRGVSQ